MSATTAPGAPGPAPAGPAGRSPAPGSLRDAALKSGAYLTAREAVGVVVRLAGLVLVMRRIGPADFGVYSAAAAYVFFPSTLAQMGAEVFLVRQPGLVARRTFDEVFTFLLLASGIVVAAGLGLTFLVAPWLRPFGVVAPLRVLLFAIPINICWAPFQACIERRFAYRRMGLLELGGDVVLYGTAAPMAFLGYGPWSLVAGFFAWQAWLLVGSMALSGLRPRLRWSSRTARALITHGRTYGLTTWIQGVRTSVVTLIVASFAGAAGVGLVTFATRLVTTMNFTDRGVHRVGLAAISQAGKDRSDRLSAALEEGTLLLLVVSALPLAAFGLCARWLIPDVFGREWLPALPVYVLLALWAILRVPVTVHRTLLYANGRNLPPAISSAIELVIVGLVSLVAVRDLGIVGYGVASVVAVSSTAYTTWSAHRLVAVRFRRLVVPFVALVPPVCVALAPLPWSLLLLLPPVLLVVHSRTRRELASIVATGRALVARRRGRQALAGGGAEMVTSAPDLAGITELLAARDPVTGLASAAVLLARLGRTLGSACEPGWAVGLVALGLVPALGPVASEAPAEELLTGIAATLRAELRFDDVVARVDRRTFVVAAMLVDGAAEGAALAAHLYASVQAVVTAAAAAALPPSVPLPPPPFAPGPAWTLRVADLVVPLPCDRQADLLVRRVVEAARG